MNTLTKQNWWKSITQRLQVIFGPRRLTLNAGNIELKESNIEIPEDFKFEKLVDIYKKYTLKFHNKTDKLAINNETSEETSDNLIISKLEFINAWRKCASGNLADETDDIALPVCFCDEAKMTYEKISKYSIMHLIKYGYIDTKEILNVTKEMNYKWARQTARKLFKTSAQAQLITDYYRLATPNAKQQHEKTLTTDQALYGLDI